MRARFLLTLGLIALPSTPARAVDICEGCIWSTVNRAAPGISLFDAAAGRGRLARGGPNGELYVTELNPDAYQNADATIVNVNLVANQANTPNPATGASLTAFDASIFGYKWAQVSITAAANAATPWSCRFWGSTDGITYKPLTSPPMTGDLSLPFQASGYFFMSGNALDTLKVRGRGVASTGWFPLGGRHGELATLKKIVAVVSVDSATGTATAVVQISGRQH